MTYFVLQEGAPGAAELTFLHGMLGTPGSILDLAPLLPPETRLTALLLPGHGIRPQMPRADLGAVIDLIASELPFWPRRILFGYSLGGRLALALSLQHPETASGVVALGAHLGIDDDEDRMARLSSDQENARTVFREGLPRFVEKWEKLPLFATQKSLSAESLDRQRKARISHTTRGIAWAFDNLSTARMQLDLSAREMPTTLAAGAEDAKFRAIAEDASKRYPGVELELIEGAGHNALLEAPAPVAAILRARLESWT